MFGIWHFTRPYQPGRATSPSFQLLHLCIHPLVHVVDLESHGKPQFKEKSIDIVDNHCSAVSNRYRCLNWFTCASLVSLRLCSFSCPIVFCSLEFCRDALQWYQEGSRSCGILVAADSTSGDQVGEDFSRVESDWNDQLEDVGRYTFIWHPRTDLRRDCSLV